MKKEDFFEVLGELDGDTVKGAEAPVKKKRNWRAWGAAAACLAVVLAAGVPRILDLSRHKGDPGQSDSLLPPLNIIEYNGAYYEVIDMTNTDTLDAYNLPHSITADMVGSSLGPGLGPDGEQTKQILHQYVPYADIAAAAGPGEERAQRAVYVVEAGGGCSFALFCNFIPFDSNTHAEAGELFAVYGVDEAADIASITIGGEAVPDAAGIQAIFDNLCNAVSMGNDGYQNAVFGGMSEEDQQALSTELADHMLEIKITTTEGVAINYLSYYPTIHYVAWALNYYQLSAPFRET